MLRFDGTVKIADQFARTVLGIFNQAGEAVENTARITRHLAGVDHLSGELVVFTPAHRVGHRAVRCMNDVTREIQTAGESRPPGRHRLIRNIPVGDRAIGLDRHKIKHSLLKVFHCISVSLGTGTEIGAGHRAALILVVIGPDRFGEQTG